MTDKIVFKLDRLAGGELEISLDNKNKSAEQEFLSGKTKDKLSVTFTGEFEHTNKSVKEVLKRWFREACQLEREKGYISIVDENGKEVIRIEDVQINTMNLTDEEKNTSLFMGR